MWQELREELYPAGLEVVTVALDTGGLAAARPFIEAAKPAHPSLIDQAHLLDELFGIINVPSAVWINEEGQIVRPPELATNPRSSNLNPDPTNPAQVLNAQIFKGKDTAEKYVGALRDWVTNGPASRYALAPEEVLQRSRPRPIEEATAAAHFELGQYLHRNGQPDAAIAHFREAHRLHFDNWTYKRQAWTFADPRQGPTEVYDGDFRSDLKKIGGWENYYSAAKLD